MSATGPFPSASSRRRWRPWRRSISRSLRRASAIRSFAGARGAERIRGEAREPVLAGIAAARDLAQSGAKVFICGLQQDLLPLRNNSRKIEESPCTAEVEAIEVRELAVRSIADLRRCGQRRGNLREKFYEPLWKSSGTQNSPHEVRFHERGREEIIPAGLPGRGIVAVGSVVK